MTGKRKMDIRVFGLDRQRLNDSFNHWFKRFSDGFKPTLHAPAPSANEEPDASGPTAAKHSTGRKHSIGSRLAGLRRRLSAGVSVIAAAPVGLFARLRRGPEAKPTAHSAANSATNNTADNPVAALHRSLRGWRRAGWAIIVFFMGGSVLWAANTRLDSAAIARGVVAVESNSKTIQHLEGGIVKEILAKNGDRVEAGQVLVRFDDTYARANLDLLEGQMGGALALQARLLTERDGASTISFPDELLKRAGDPKVSELMVGQVDIFESRRKRAAQQESILRERINKSGSEIVGLKAQVTAGDRQLALLGEEIAGAQSLLDKGLEKRSRVLALRRKAAEIAGNIGDFRAQIGRVGQNISELHLQLTLLRSRDQNQTAEQLQQVQAHIADLREKVYAARDVLKRTRVVAPQSGTVVDLRVHTPGGVVQPGQRLMSLVPDRDRLIVDVRVDPRDIDTVYVGMPARVRLTAFNARSNAPLEGKVVSVSADQVTDPISGVSYFTARIVPDEGGSRDIKLTSLVPGMQAEVFLVTSERTALEYMVQPIARSFNRAGREQ